MQILNLSFLTHSIPVLKEKVLDALSIQQQRIAVIVSIIFASLATLFALRCYFLRDKNIDVLNQDQLSDKTQSPVKTEDVTSEILKTSPRSDKHTHNPEKVETQHKKLTPPKESSKVNKNDAISKDLIHQKSSSSIMEIVDQIAALTSPLDKTPQSEEDTQDSDEDISSEENLDDFNLDDLSDEDEESIEKSLKKLGPKSTHYINGKEVSYRTLRCLQILEKNLEASGKKHGTAIDNGDCFWHAFAQRLSVILNRPVTIKELRQQVSEEIQRLDKGPQEENWVRKIMATDLLDDYERYRDNVAFIGDEIGSEIIWGRQDRDGLILCHLYQVNLRVYSIGCLDDNPDQMDNDDNFYMDDREFPKETPYSQTIEIALYPGHFIPVYDKTKAVENIE